MKLTRRVAGVAAAAVAAVALPLAVATPALASCAPGTYPPSSCAPSLTITSPTSVVSLGATQVSWKVANSSAAIKSYQVRYERTSWNGDFGSWVYPASWSGITVPSVTTTVAIGYTECFSVRATDTANRVGPWATPRCTVRPLDDRSFSVSRGWTRGTSSAYYLGTFSTTARTNATAVLAAGKATRIAVIATRCRTCGVIGVYLGSKLIVRLDYASSSTSPRVVEYSGRFPLTSGSITIKNMTPGRRIILDGVAVGRA